MKKNLSIILLILTALAVSERGMADSGPQYYRSAVHNGNRVMTVFGNWGVIGQPVDTRPRGAWIYPSNGYIGDVSPMVGAEVKKNGLTFHQIITVPVDRPQSNPRDVDPISGAPWSFMPEGGYFNPNKQSIAMSDDKTTWPPQWPDKMNDALDPGWPGSWNGYFGKTASADQESYYVMDDNNDKRFNIPTNNIFGVSFHPDSTNLSRNGLGLEMKVRGMQWAQLLAQDNIFWLYEITNTGTTTYDRSFFGMLVGTYVGVTGATDFHEYDDDWSFYNVQENITYTGDFPRDNSRNPFWVGPVGMVGYAFLESPGNPFDGVDNDGDADNSLTGASSPYFTAADFDSVLIKAGNRYVLIDENYGRHVFTMPDTAITVVTRGLPPMLLKPGVTKLGEGGLVTVNGIETVNPNAYDGADNDLDGLIDENYYLHFHQIKKTSDTPPVVLIDVLRPVRHRDFVANPGTDPYSMIDERRDDLIDNNRDWDINYDDVGRDGIANTGDYGEKDGQPTSGYLANGFDTGLPGEPHIDKTDVNESDQIGLTSFQYFTPANDISFGDKETLWRRYAPGFFAVPKSIVNNVPQYGEDGDFLYGSGYFPLLAKHTERFSMALVYGGGNGGTREDDIADLLKHKQSVQKIYNANYQFPIPPQPAPTLTAVAGDGKVNLYWDRKSEDAVDPVLRIKDFQGYKIFKASDQNFNDVFNVTNANGVKKGYQPTFQVDKKDSIQGYFRAPADLFNSTEGFTYYLGANTGLVHDTTDKDVVNGRVYYYAIVAYDNGDEVTGILPSQNNWKIDLDQAGRIIGHSQNVAIVTPGTKSIGYQAPPGTQVIPPVASLATGTIGYKVVDETALTAHTYEVTFKDTRDSGKAAAVTTTYNVRDLAFYTSLFTPNRIDTIITSLPQNGLVPGSVTITKMDGTVIPASSYAINYDRGTMKALVPYVLQPDTVNLRKLQIKYQYYPVNKSKNIQGSPYTSETKDTDIFDGVQLYFNNYWGIGPIDTLMRFSRYLPAYSPSLSTIALDLVINNQNVHVDPTRYPADYDVIFANSPVDTSRGDLVGDVNTPVNFRVYNRTDKRYIQFFFADNDGSGNLTKADQIYFFDYDTQNKPMYTWFVDISTPSGQRDTIYHLGTGDTLFVRTTKPFRAGDVYSFTTQKPVVNVAVRDTLFNTIRVVPNPYIVASSREQPLTPGTFGRGERRIEFQNCPSDAKISIFTARGELVRRLTADGNIANGVIPWDVKSSENLDIAYGVYFYVVQSSAGTRTGKLAIIK
jgi:hypothetical protein